MSAVNIAGDLFIITSDGIFGKLKINDNGIESFEPLCSSIFDSEYAHYRKLFR